MPKWLLLFLTLSASTCLASSLDRPRFLQVDVADGLPSNGTTEMTLDRDGYLWVGTRDGLARYDGIGYRIYRYAVGDNNGLPGNYISTLYADTRGRIWVSVEGHGLSVLDAQRQRFRHINQANQPLLKSNDIWAITETADGAIWFGTFGGGLYRIDRQDHLTRFLHEPGNPTSLPADNVLAVTIDTRGVLWVGTTGGLARFIDGAFQALPETDLSHPLVVSLSADPDGSLWIGTRKGLDHRLANGQIDHPPWLKDLPTPVVMSVLTDREGTRWLSTRLGLRRVQAGVLDPLSDAEVGRVAFNQGMEDNEGGLWFVTEERGLFRLPAGWRHFSLLALGQAPDGQSALPSAELARDGRVLLVSGGKLDRFDPRTGALETLAQLPTNMGVARHASIAERSDGSIWVGLGTGLCRLSTTGSAMRCWRNDGGEDPLLTGPVNRLEETPDRLLWLASYGGGVQARDEQGKTVFSITPEDGKGVDSPDQDQIATGPDGVLWLAGPKGMRRWNDDIQRFETIVGAPNERVFGFTFVPPSTVWLYRMAALEAYHWNGSRLNRIRQVGAEQGLPAANAGGLVADHTGAIWLTSARGLVRYDPTSNRLRLFGVRDGLPSQEFDKHAPVLTEHGLGLASTNAGLVLFDPSWVKVSNQSLKVVLESISFRRGDERIEVPVDTHKITLEPNDRDLRVSARLLSFIDPNTHRYRFWLHGYDPDWVEVGNQGERFFSKLEPGNYKIDISATNAEGEWSPAHGFDLHIAAPWRQTAAAKVLFTLAALTLLGLLAALYRQLLKRRHAQGLREQRQQLTEEGSEAKSRFLATLGHEIRTPMTGVLGMSELLLGEELPLRQRGRVESIQQAGQHLLRLVNDALDLARIEAGKLTLLDEPFDVNKVLEEVVDLMRPLALAKGLTFELQRSPGTPRALRGDAGRVRQILLNLCNNAIKFTERGEVALRTAALSPQGVLLEVSDSGPGMSAEQLSRLFQRFEQADGARTAQRYGGSGLGLAICQELADAMQGQVGVDSLPGQGSTFRVMLPLASARLDQLPTQITQVSSASGQGLSILCVEDDATVAEVLIGLLTALGHRPQHAAHALDALTRLKTDAIDLAFVDLDLPGVDGFTLAGLIASQGHTLALVALTARSDAQAEVLAMAAGMKGFLRKPVTGLMLQKAIDQTINLP